MNLTDKKRFRDRANRAVRELEKEKSIFGRINDKAGKRYRIGVYYLLAGDLKKSVEAFDWFYREFPDDVGEPVFNLYGALAAYRNGESNKARGRLLEAMLSNIFLLPALIGKEMDVPDIWYSSNRDQAEYLFEIGEFLDEPTSEELSWIEAELATRRFAECRDGYIATFGALSQERDISRRMDILAKWQSFQAEHLSMND